jgi:hypothetical protein
MAGLFDDIGQGIASILSPQNITGALAALDPYSGLISAGMSAVGGLMSNASNRQSASQAQDFSASQFATRYQTTVKDMMAAGLNPMLAYSQGGGSPPTGVPYQAQNPFQGVGSAYQAGMSGDVSEYLAPSQQRLNVKQGSLAESSADLNKAQIKVVNETVDKVKAETSNLKSQNDQITATVAMLAQQANLMKAQKLNTEEQTKVFVETVKKIDKETQLLKFDIKAANEMSNLGRSMGQLKPMFDLLVDVLKLIRPRH